MQPLAVNESSVLLPLFALRPDPERALRPTAWPSLETHAHLLPNESKFKATNPNACADEPDCVAAPRHSAFVRFALRWCRFQTEPNGFPHQSLVLIVIAPRHSGSDRLERRGRRRHIWRSALRIDGCWRRGADGLASADASTVAGATAGASILKARRDSLHEHGVLLLAHHRQPLRHDEPLRLQLMRPPHAATVPSVPPAVSRGMKGIPYVHRPVVAVDGHAVEGELLGDQEHLLQEDACGVVEEAWANVVVVARELDQILIACVRVIDELRVVRAHLRRRVGRHGEHLHATQGG